MLAVDAHQHLWSAPLWEALRRRRQAPFLDADHGRFTLHLPAEPASLLLGPDVIDDRAALLRHDGVDRALVAPSTALGLEWLRPEESAPLIDAYREGVRDLGPAFGWWATTSLVELDLDAVDADLDAGAAGLCLSAAALSDPRQLDQLAPLLTHLAARDVPLFVHPGPGPAQLGLGDAARWREEPWWWASVTDYVSEMQRAWLLWAARGRREHPELRVLFAMLAGLAPLQLSRLAARGAHRVVAEATADRLTFLDTSSYGPAARAAVASAVGASQLVHGSDRPVVTADLTVAPAGDEATVNAHALLRKAA